MFEFLNSFREQWRLKPKLLEKQEQKLLRLKENTKRVEPSDKLPK